MFKEDDLLPIRALADLVFCERRAALHYIEGMWEENLFTVEGSLLHEKAHSEDRLESRGDLRIARGLRLRSLRLGLIGVADVVEFHRLDAAAASEQAPPPAPSTQPPREGEAASALARGVPLGGARGLWRPFPVEYKRGRLRREEGYEVQLCAQALCLEEMLAVSVPAGAVFYGQPRRRLDVAFDEDLRRQTESAAARLHQLIASAETPPARYENKCESCSLLSQCMPRRLTNKPSVRGYVERSLSETEP